MKKVNLEMTRAFKRIMNQLVLDQDVDTYADVFRNGIALLTVAQKAWDEGKTLAVIKDGKIEKVLVMDK